jgi:cobyrinic acid a,c-diamide synthase
MNCPRLVIGATASGSGKTSATLALAAAFRRRGLSVQTFKAGPDYLDPAWLALASGRPCYNLDGWMCGEPYVRRLFHRAACGADLTLIEGVMGLFDGADPASLAGSTAEVARWLEAPVLLVVNAHGAARSLAATVAGFARFEAGVRVGGVIANSCGSERHADWVAESLRAAGQPPLLGAVPRGGFPELPSRHLGLAAPQSGSTLGAFADAAERRMSLDGILALAASASPLALPAPSAEATPRPAPSGEATPLPAPGAESTARPAVRLGVARDAAFQFYYPDNLEALEAAGAVLVSFSPLADARLPAALDGLYFGGGYPEEHARELSANASMLAGVRAFAAGGRPVYAECGGLMYLSRAVETLDGSRHAMAGVLPVATRMLARRKALGYVEASPERDSLFAAAGETMRGHEFHYSEVAPGEEGGPWRPAYRVSRRRDATERPEGFECGRVLASYVHLHFASHPGAAARLVRACQESRP